MAPPKVASKKPRSIVWRFYRLPDPSNPNVVRCPSCSSEFKYHGSTTGIMSHLQTQHAEDYKKLLRQEICKKNGKTYKIGEEFDVGNLRYTCQEFGVYVIAGCRTHTGKPLKLGDIEVIDHVKIHCLAHGTSVYYRETACGKKGEVDCDKVPLPRGYEQAVKNESIETTEKPPAHLTHVNGKELPKGWVLIHGGTKEADNKNDTLSTHILMYHPQLHHSAKHAH